MQAYLAPLGLGSFPHPAGRSRQIADPSSQIRLRILAIRDSATIAESGRGRVIAVTDFGWIANFALTEEGVGDVAIKGQNNWAIFRRLTLCAAHAEWPQTVAAACRRYLKVEPKFKLRSAHLQPEINGTILKFCLEVTIRSARVKPSADVPLNAAVDLPCKI